MNHHLREQLSQVLDEVQRKQQEVFAAQADLRERSGTAKSKNRMLSATVDADGQLSNLEFHDDRYRTMPRAELAAAIVDVVRQARTDMMSQIEDVLGSQLDDVNALRDRMYEGTSMGEFLEPLLKIQRKNTERMRRSYRHG
ncbi:YbaB/EbfC family nucleoid-associated protein [Saccharopolyspora rosea]|uniref:YbaB/EbfC family nucleoid-associated protein n=1 Tax=Saccharopolyspora rosea TaxID=524884 RepID=UPI0021D9145D|nr:YbaB/EbfC family nucleoid-associated protein [Saccharopolyspora rosea]